LTSQSLYKDGKFASMVSMLCGVFLFPSLVAQRVCHAVRACSPLAQALLKIRRDNDAACTLQYLELVCVTSCVDHNIPRVVERVLSRSSITCADSKGVTAQSCSSVLIVCIYSLITLSNVDNAFAASTRLLAFLRQWSTNCADAKLAARGPSRQSIVAIESWVDVAQPLVKRELEQAQGIAAQLWAAAEPAVSAEIGVVPELYFLLKRYVLRIFIMLTSSMSLQILDGPCRIVLLLHSRQQWRRFEVIGTAC
jgi:hypothetical protein